MPTPPHTYGQARSWQETGGFWGPPISFGSLVYVPTMDPSYSLYAVPTPPRLQALAVNGDWTDCPLLDYSGGTAEASFVGMATYERPDDVLEFRIDDVTSGSQRSEDQLG